MLSPSQREVLVRDIRRRVPRRPGVYLFYDSSSGVLYVGKSVSLRDRMLSYFRARLSHSGDRTAQMAFHIHHFAFRETATELLALLLEDALIKEKMPPYNVRQREAATYLYLLLTDDPYPALKMVDEGSSGTGTLFGPFGDQYLVADVVGLVTRHLHLRSCSDPVPHRRCMNYDIGLCAGPCRGQVTEGEYGGIVRQAMGFLEGEEGPISQAIRWQMEAAAERGDYEKARDMKYLLQFVARFCSRQRFFHQFRSQAISVREPGEPGVEYCFQCGALSAVRAAGSLPTEGQKEGQIDFPAELCRPVEDARFLLDRADLVYTWVHRRRASPMVDTSPPVDTASPVDISLPVDIPSPAGNSPPAET